MAGSSIDDYERAFNNHVNGEKSTVRGLRPRRRRTALVGRRLVAD
ncbi:hypothetical protein ACFVWG_10315 [Kribbella sp. NPDC058245]